MERLMDEALHEDSFRDLCLLDVSLAQNAAYRTRSDGRGNLRSELDGLMSPREFAITIPCYDRTGSVQQTFGAQREAEKRR